MRISKMQKKLRLMLAGKQSYRNINKVTETLHNIDDYVGWNFAAQN